mmetsp:Transcript_98702/g.235148  ORF Transcript_98702/g.235148 Transcript_98702/m.235148 type:complete len:236 (-) Transcript_98702:27-734(-)
MHQQLLENVTKISCPVGMPFKGLHLCTHTALVGRQLVERRQAWVVLCPLRRRIRHSLLYSCGNLPLRGGLEGAGARQAALPVDLELPPVLRGPAVVDAARPRRRELPLALLLRVRLPSLPGARLGRAPRGDWRWLVAVLDVGRSKLLQALFPGCLLGTPLFSQQRTGRSTSASPDLPEDLQLPHHCAAQEASKNWTQSDRPSATWPNSHRAVQRCTASWCKLRRQHHGLNSFYSE